MIFKVISHFFLNKTNLITGSSNITSSENLAEKTAVRFSEKKQSTFWNFLCIQLNITPLEHYPILASLILMFIRKLWELMG